MAVRRSIIKDYSTLEGLALRKRDWTFNGFAEVWRSLKFSYSHFGFHNADCEYEEYLTEYFQHITSHWGSDCETDARCCATLTAYSLYATQVSSPKVKIRLSPTSWDDLLELYRLIQHDRLKTSVVQAIWSLCATKAFVFAVVANPLKEENPRESIEVSWSTTNSATHFAASHPVVEMDTSIALQYDDLKKSLTESVGINQGLLNLSKPPGRADFVVHETDVVKDKYVQERTKLLRSALRKGPNARINKKRKVFHSQRGEVGNLSQSPSTAPISALPAPRIFSPSDTTSQPPANSMPSIVGKKDNLDENGRSSHSSSECSSSDDSDGDSADEFARQISAPFSGNQSD